METLISLLYHLGGIVSRVSETAAAQLSKQVFRGKIRETTRAGARVDYAETGLC